MKHRKLPNYLRTHRRRAGFSQDEVAFVLGCRSGAKASRHERHSRVPGLETALAYEALFGVPVRELFAGVYQKVETDVLKRARILEGKLSAAGGADRATLRKRYSLQALSCPAESVSSN